MAKKFEKIVKEMSLFFAQTFFVFLAFACFIASSLFGYFFLTGTVFIEQFSSVTSLLLFVATITFGYMSFEVRNMKRF